MAEPITQKCKGARDLLPEDLEVFRYIESVFRRSCLSWGYSEVRTPTLEYLSLFTAAGTLTPSMLGHVYSFLDWDGWSGERVVLRPDGTIPIARLYAENSSRWESARLFYVTNVFVFEETGTESRERWQCGAEFINGGHPWGDVEVLSLAVEVLNNLGLSGVKILLSHAGVLGALIKELKLDKGEEARILDRVLDGDWEVLTTIASGEPAIRDLIPLILGTTGSHSAFMKNLKSLPYVPKSVSSALDEFIKVTELLDALGIEYQVDVTSVRGFEYYTGVCFQFLYQGKKVGSGGRYDNLLPLIGGKRAPACGFALYVDPLMSVVSANNQPRTGQRVVIRCEDDTPEAIKTAFTLAGILRSRGLLVELSFAGLKPAAAHRWLVRVHRKLNGFSIIDREREQVRRVRSVNSVVDVVGGGL